MVVSSCCVRRAFSGDDRGGWREQVIARMLGVTEGRFRDLRRMVIEDA
jgi:hypothetical protein